MRRRIRYIDALKLIEKCIEHQILLEKEGMVCACLCATQDRKEDMYLIDKDSMAKELMVSLEGQNSLILELKKKNIEYPMPKEMIEK